MKDILINDCYQKLSHRNDEELEKAKAVYHSECYKNVTNVSKIQRLRESFEKREHVVNNEVSIQ